MSAPAWPVRLTFARGRRELVAAFDDGSSGSVDFVRLRENRSAGYYGRAGRAGGTLCGADFLLGRTFKRSLYLGPAETPDGWRLAHQAREACLIGTGLTGQGAPDGSDPAGRDEGKPA